MLLLCTGTDVSPLAFLAALLRDDCVARAVLLRVVSTTGCTGVTADDAAAAVKEAAARSGR